MQNILDEVSGWLSGKPYTIDRQGRDRIVVTLPPGQDPGAIRPILTRRGVMTFRAVASDVSIRDAREGRLPAGTTLLPERGSGEAGNEHELVVRDEVLVDGANLVEAEAMRDWFDRPAVTIRFDDIGTENFGHATANAIGERIAIVVDDEVISAPVINEPILDGVAQISGAFTVQEANDLALILRAGALPAPVTIISEQWLSGESDE